KTSRQVGIQLWIDPLQHSEGCRRCQPGYADKRFGGAIPKQRIAGAIDQPTCKEAPQSEAAHKAGEDGACCVDRYAKYEPQQPEPQHLVDQAADPGNEK